MANWLTSTSTTKIGRDSPKKKRFQRYRVVLWIRNILVLSGSGDPFHWLTDPDSDPDSYPDPDPAPAYTSLRVSRITSQKEVTNRTVETNVFLTIFHDDRRICICTNNDESGSGRSKNIRTDPNPDTQHFSKEFNTLRNTNCTWRSPRVLSLDFFFFFSLIGSPIIMSVIWNKRKNRSLTNPEAETKEKHGVWDPMPQWL